MKIFVLLPAYNEAVSLPNLLPKIQSYFTQSKCNYLVITCNDGSKDETGALLAEYAKVMPIKVITHKINRGLGETIRDLFEYVAEISQAGDIVVRLDCDDTHDPHLIEHLVNKIQEGYDVVIASRYQPGGGQSGLNAYRTFISRCAGLYMKIIFPIKNVRDYTSGYRAYRATIIKKAITVFGNNFIQLKGVGFTCTIEKLIKFNLLNAKFAEIASVLRYDQKQSESKMISSITTIGYFLLAIMYHWPWGGWRRNYRYLKKYPT